MCRASDKTAVRERTVVDPENNAKEHF